MWDDCNVVVVFFTILWRLTSLFSRLFFITIFFLFNWYLFAAWKGICCNCNNWTNISDMTIIQLGIYLCLYITSQMHYGIINILCMNFFFSRFWSWNDIDLIHQIKFICFKFFLILILLGIVFKWYQMIEYGNALITQKFKNIFWIFFEFVLIFLKYFFLLKLFRQKVKFPADIIFKWSFFYIFKRKNLNWQFIQFKNEFFIKFVIKNYFLS